MLSETPMSTPPLILICDDEAHIRHVVATKLRGAGMVVREARNGEEALEAVRGHEAFRPHLVITDFQMPLLSGLELAKALRDTPATSRTPVLMLTARGYVLSEDELALTNVREVMSKPFGVKQLLERVQHVLARPPHSTSKAA
jgi:CheY-like chemotaxis protein